MKNDELDCQQPNLESTKQENWQFANPPVLLQESFTDNERMFLMHLKSGTPNWSLLPIENIEQLNKLKRVLKI